MIYKKLWFCTIFPFPSLLYLPTFHRFSPFPFPAFYFPNYPPLPLTFLFYSSVVPYIHLYLSTCPRPYFSSSTPVSFSTYLLPYQSSSPRYLSPFTTLPLFRSYSSPFPLLFSSPFPFISPLFLSPFYSLFISLFVSLFPPLSLLLGGGGRIL